MIRYQDPRVRSPIITSGIGRPVGSDRIMKEMLLQLPDRGKLRREIDRGEARWVANKSGGRIYGVELSFDDLSVPAIDDVWGGNIYTITLALLLGATIFPGQTSVTVNRTPIAAGLDPNGIRVVDGKTGAPVAGWTQSGDGLRKFTLAESRMTETIVWYRFTNDWMVSKNLQIDYDRVEDKATTRITLEEVVGTNVP